MNLLSIRYGAMYVLFINGILSLIYLYINKYIPFPFDNNETFSSIIHAKNLENFSFQSTYGVTDEGFGASVESHPYVYTHQGNFPRFFSLLLNLLNIKSAEGHILITSLLISSISFYFAYKFFEKKVTPIFGLIFCLFLLTDYFMYFQWQYNTWRCWHFFFIFTSLVLIDNTFILNKKTIYSLLVLNYSCLIYFEISFGIFLFVASAVYLILGSKELKIKLKVFVYQSIGLVLGILILTIQLVLYYGYDGLYNDIYYTFVARNFSPENKIELLNFQKEIWDFFETNKIAFWDNHVSKGMKLRDFIVSFSLYFKFNLMNYSPYLIFVFLLMNIIIFFNIISVKFKNYSLYFDSRNIKFFFSLLALLFLVLIYFDSKFAGFSPKLISNNILSKKTLLLFVLAVITIVIWINSNKSSDSKVSINKVVICSLFLLSIFCLSQFGYKLYNFDHGIPIVNFEGFWENLFHFNIIYAVLSKYFIFILIIFGLDSILFNRNLIVDDNNKGIQKEILVYFVSGAIGFIFIWMLMPGYILSAYFQRYVPLLVFFNIIIFVYPVFILLNFIIFSFKNSNSNNKEISINFKKPVILLLVFIPIIYWINLQHSYFSKFENKQFTLYKLLNSDKYKGSSFVVNAYSAAISVQTEQWSYYDSKFEKGNIVLTENGYRYISDYKYLWFADRNSNQEYLYPDYFLCLSNQGIDLLFNTQDRCLNDIGLIDKIKSNYYLKENIDLQNKLVDYDSNDKTNMWSIVKLDKDFPPYLLPSIDTQRIVSINIKDVSKKSIYIDYFYKQQNNVPEDGTEIIVMVLDSCKNKKLVSSNYINPNNNEIKINDSMINKVLQISVQPKTKTKHGMIYMSQPFLLTTKNSIFEYCADEQTLDTPFNIKIEPSTDGRNLNIFWNYNDSAVRYFEILSKTNNTDEMTKYTIDAKQREFSMSILKFANNIFNVRACNDWTCSMWSDDIIFK